LILIFKQASLKPFFKSLLALVEESGQFYEFAITYPTLLDRLKGIADPLASTLTEVFLNFAFDSLQILSALRLVLHEMCVGEGRREKKITVSVYSHPMVEMVGLRANMIENFISVEGVVVKVQQMRLMATEM
jgi:DNA replicative helicase MCM subunit Mcm2 (Cdc46/Mcm family)